jgi:uncharacterized protein
MIAPIVVDTSVVISALIGSKGPAREVLRRCLHGDYAPLISNALFQEYEDVSRRAAIVKKTPLTANEIQELMSAFYSVCRWVPIYYLWRPNLLDENDNFLVELAVAGNARGIVTNNTKDLKAAELTFPDFEILTPEDLLRRKSWEP